MKIDFSTSSLYNNIPLGNELSNMQMKSVNTKLTGNEIIQSFAIDTTYPQSNNSRGREKI